MPQLSVELQPSLMPPQFFPWAAQVVGVQTPGAHTFAVLLPPHVCPVGHALPQSNVPPQPSKILPQFLPSAVQVVGVHVDTVHASACQASAQQWPVFSYVPPQRQPVVTAPWAQAAQADGVDAEHVEPEPEFIWPLIQATLNTISPISITRGKVTTCCLRVLSM